MNRLTRLVLQTLSVLTVLAVVQPAAAQTRTVLPAPQAHHGFLYIYGMRGTTAYPYRYWHAVDSFGLEARNIVRSGRTIAKTFSPLSVGADLGVALPQLVVNCASGRTFPYVILRMFRNGESRYFVEFRLYNATIVSVSGAGKDTPGGGQTVEFDYSRMIMTQVDTTTGARTSRSIDRSVTPFSRGGRVPVSGAESNDYEVFVRVEGIAGTSRRSGYSGWHEVDSYDIGVRKNSSSTPRFSPLRLKSRLSALPQFTMAALSGTVIKTVVVHVWSKSVTTGPVLIITLADVLVSKARSIADSKVSGQTLELNYGRVQFQYFKGGRDSKQGSTSGGWNLSTNTAQ